MTPTRGRRLCLCRLKRLTKVVLQYRPVTGGEWITAKSEEERFATDGYKFNLLCDHSRGDGCKFDWSLNNDYDKLLSGFKDGVYELRVKNLCSGASALAASSVHEYVGDQVLTLTIDTVFPKSQGKHHDAGSYTIWASFSEAIDCAGAHVEVEQIYDASCTNVSAGAVTDEELRSNYEMTCVNNAGRGEWIMTYPEESTGTYIARVSNIKDTSGNAARSFAYEYVAGGAIDWKLVRTEQQGVVMPRVPELFFSTAESHQPSQISFVRPSPAAHRRTSWCFR